MKKKKWSGQTMSTEDEEGAMVLETVAEYVPCNTFNFY